MGKHLFVYKKLLAKNKQTKRILACAFLYVFCLLNFRNINTCYFRLYWKCFQLYFVWAFRYFPNLFCLHNSLLCTNHEKQFCNIFKEIQIHKHLTWRLWLSHSCFFNFFIYTKHCIHKFRGGCFVYKPFPMVFFNHSILHNFSFNERQCFLLKTQIWHTN